MMGAERSLVTVFLSRMWANGLILKASKKPVKANPAHRPHKTRRSPSLTWSEKVEQRTSLR